MLVRLDAGSDAVLVAAAIAGIISLAAMEDCYSLSAAVDYSLSAAVDEVASHVRPEARL
jgi:DMSO reductase anchor subunit